MASLLMGQQERERERKVSLALEIERGVGEGFTGFREDEREREQAGFHSFRGRNSFSRKKHKLQGIPVHNTHYHSSNSKLLPTNLMYACECNTTAPLSSIET